MYDFSNRRKAEASFGVSDPEGMKTEPNKALEPTTMPATFRADARTAPGMVAAQF
jgi:hypothetical protein